MATAAIPLILTAISTIAQYNAARNEGDAAYEAAKARAAQTRQQAELDATMRERQAGEDRSSSQRAAQEARRVSRIKQSRAMALAAASGGGAVDPTVINILGGLQAEGDYNASSELYKGEDSATYQEWLAKVSRVRGENQANQEIYQGKVAKSAGIHKANSTLASGAYSMFSIYSGQSAMGKTGGEAGSGSDPMDYGSSSVSNRNWWEN